MAAVAHVLNGSWTPSVLMPTPILTEHATYSFDRSRHLMRYVTYVDRDPIMRDFFTKLQARTGRTVDPARPHDDAGGDHQRLLPSASYGSSAAPPPVGS